TEATSFGGISRQREQMVRYGLSIPSPNQKAGLLIEADFTGAIKVVRNDRLSGRQSLRQSAGHGLAVREMNEAVHNADVPGDFSRRDEAGEHGFFSKPISERLGFQFVAQRTIAEQQQAKVGFRF